MNLLFSFFPYYQLYPVLLCVAFRGYFTFLDGSLGTVSLLLCLSTTSFLSRFQIPIMGPTMCETMARRTHSSSGDRAGRVEYSFSPPYGFQEAMESHLQEDFGLSHFPVFVCPQAQVSNAQGHLAVFVLKLLRKTRGGQGLWRGVRVSSRVMMQASQQGLSDYTQAFAYTPG